MNLSGLAEGWRRKGYRGVRAPFCGAIDVDKRNPELDQKLSRYIGRLYTSSYLPTKSSFMCEKPHSFMFHVYFVRFSRLTPFTSSREGWMMDSGEEIGMEI